MTHAAEAVWLPELRVTSSVVARADQMRPVSRPATDAVQVRAS